MKVGNSQIKGIRCLWKSLKSTQTHRLSVICYRKMYLKRWQIRENCGKNLKLNNMMYICPLLHQRKYQIVKSQMYRYLKQINYTPIQITDSMSAVAQQIIDMSILTKVSFSKMQKHKKSCNFTERGENNYLASLSLFLIVSLSLFFLIISLSYTIH